MLELYHSGLSTCSKQVRLCLAEKGLDYVSHYVELWRFENLSPAYLALNPHGVVPTLVHDGHAIFNSLVINEYLDDVFPEVPLRPADPLARAKARLWEWMADDVHVSVMMPTYMSFLKNHAAELTPDEVDRMLAATPVPDRRERWIRTTSGGYGDKELQAAYDKIDFVLGRFEDDLGDGTWIAGESYSLGDIAMLAIVHRVRELRPELLDPARRARTIAWHARMMERPAVPGVYTAGGPETPARPSGISIEGIAAAAE
jgi:glutathione S-transferase